MTHPKHRLPFGPLPDPALDPFYKIEAYWNYCGRDHLDNNVVAYGVEHIYFSLEEAILDYRKAKRRRAKVDRPTEGFYIVRRTRRGLEERQRNYFGPDSAPWADYLNQHFSL
jgi:hypothetical protein